MMITSVRERNRFFRFALVGIIGAVVDFGVFNILTLGVRFEAVPSSVISFLMAVLSNFIWNRYWTYPDSRAKSVPRQISQFILVSVVGLLIRTPLFAWLEPRLVKSAVNMLASLSLQSVLTPTFIGHNTALAIAVLVVMMWNFFANRYWTYSDVT